MLKHINPLAVLLGAVGGGYGGYAKEQDKKREQMNVETEQARRLAEMKANIANQEGRLNLDTRMGEGQLGVLKARLGLDTRATEADIAGAIADRQAQADRWAKDFGLREQVELGGLGVARTNAATAKQNADSNRTAVNMDAGLFVSSPEEAKASGAAILAERSGDPAFDALFRNLTTALASQRKSPEEIAWLVNQVMGKGTGTLPNVLPGAFGGPQDSPPSPGGQKWLYYDRSRPNRLRSDFLPTPRP